MFLKWLTPDHWRFESTKNRLIKLIRQMEPTRRDFTFFHESRDSRDLDGVQGIHRLSASCREQFYGIAIVHLNRKTRYAIVLLHEDKFNIMTPNGNWIHDVERFPTDFMSQGSVYLRWLIALGDIQDVYLNYIWASHWLGRIVEYRQRDEKQTRLREDDLGKSILKLESEVSFWREKEKKCSSRFLTVARAIQLTSLALEPVVGASDNHRALLSWFRGMNDYLTNALFGGAEHQMPEVPALKGGRRKKSDVPAEAGKIS